MNDFTAASPFVFAEQMDQQNIRRLLNQRIGLLKMKQASWGVTWKHVSSDAKPQWPCDLWVFCPPGIGVEALERHQTYAYKTLASQHLVGSWGFEFQPPEPPKSPEYSWANFDPSVESCSRDSAAVVRYSFEEASPANILQALGLQNVGEN